MEGPFAHVVYVDKTASTNEDAAALLGDDAALGMTIVAEEQTGGLGRKGRRWVAQRGRALLFTTILPRELAAGALWAVPFWTALCVAEALERSGVATTLVWPNDLLIGERKVAGILCVSRVFGDRARAGCGVGINVYGTPQARNEIVPPPAFCDDVARVDRNALLARILDRFNESLTMLSDPHQVAHQWERRAGLPGRRYRLLVDGEADAFDVTALRLSSDGGLVVERGGAERTIALADARVLR
ncbi:MAG: biotin--[acetyl-CoA-carboxylase] ligase [Candidatus Tyrphobacter sp.]